MGATALHDKKRRILLSFRLVWLGVRNGSMTTCIQHIGKAANEASRAQNAGTTAVKQTWMDTPFCVASVGRVDAGILHMDCRLTQSSSGFAR